MAAYESGDGKKNLKIGNYYKSDYISWNLVKSFVSATLAYLICLGIYIAYNIEYLLQEIYNMDLMLFLQDILVKYVVFLLAYQFFAYIFYYIQYQKVRNSLQSYYRRLNELIKIYKNERIERRTKL